jgi:hypothetical protein
LVPYKFHINNMDNSSSWLSSFSCHYNSSRTSLFSWGSHWPSLAESYVWRTLYSLQNSHLDLVDLPPGKTMIGWKWVYKIKTKSDGSIQLYKAHLVAKGFNQEYGIDYEGTFELVAWLTSIWSLLVVAFVRRWGLFRWTWKMRFSMVISLIKFICSLPITIQRKVLTTSALSA